MQKKPPFINIVIVALLALLTVLIGLLSGIAPNELPPAVTPYLRFIWPLLGIVTLAFIGLTIWQAVRQSTDGHDKTTPRSEHHRQSIEKQNRQRMLAKVHAFWIKGVLEQSLHGAALIALGLREQPDAVANPWRLVFQQPDQAGHELPLGTRITQVYNDAGGELLILGDPGSGKTTLLLELARDLLDRAQKDDSHPIPVVFNLSSWAVKRQPLADWFVEELNAKYQVPRKLSQSWADNNQILPLLDGLDEVVSDYRAACVDAINTYRREHMASTVVCSRSTEYLNQARRVLLRCAVAIQPLTEQQVDDYLSSAGRQLAAVRVALRKDTELQELATTPLMLSVLTLAYHGKTVEDILTSGSHESRRRQVFATYIPSMLKRRGTETRYTPQQIVYWLTWLAKQLTKHNQTEFYIERMQPSMLPEDSSRRFYHTLVVKLLGGVTLGWTFGILCGALGTMIGEMYGGAHIALYAGITSGLGVGLICLVLGLIKGVFTTTEIRPVEVIAWSWVKRRSFAKSLIRGFMFILIAGLILIIVHQLNTRVFFIISWAIPVIIISYVGIEISRKSLSNDKLVRPNQGIRRSAGNGIVVGLVTGLFIGLLAGWLGGLLCSVIFGLGFGIAVALANGGVPCIEHGILRWLLWRAGYAPLNYPHFLDYAADRILLRKVGGGYIFVHRLLQDYFASLDTATKSSGVSEQT